MKRPLDVVNAVCIPESCPMPWGEMRSTSQARHCERCNQTVHDLSAMTAAEGAALLTSGQQACVRLTRRPDGTPVTRDHPYSLVERLRWLVVAVLSWLGVAVVSGCGHTMQGAYGPLYGSVVTAIPEQDQPSAETQAADQKK
jgi:hypothetical protein